MTAPAEAVSLTTTPPSGSHFEMEEVKTAKGTQSLGEVPILVWDSLEGAVAHFTEEGVKDCLDGTSPRVSYQGIARRMKAAGKTDDEIRSAQIGFKPGKRQGGVSTPVSRASKAAKSAAEKVDGDVVAKLLEQIASGKLSQADIQALTQ